MGGSYTFHAGSRAASSSPFPATKRFRPPPPPAGEPFRVFVGSDPRENEAYEAHGFLSIPSLTINLEHHQQSGAHGISSLDDRPRQPAITIYGKYDSGAFPLRLVRKAPGERALLRAREKVKLPRPGPRGGKEAGFFVVGCVGRSIEAKASDVLRIGAPQEMASTR
ncbi:hypothetical protein EJB05_36976, partial [Eragrostis curvula]